MMAATERTQVNPYDLAQWAKGAWRGTVPDKVEGVGHDSRVIQSGQLYVAIRGAHHDGHRFVEDAFQRSASAALVDEAYAQHISSLPGPLLVVKDTHRALKDLARGHRAACAARIIGITGSVGKTTVKELVADILADGDATVARTQGNWNNDIGLPLSLLKMAPDDRYGVFEVGMNHPGEIAPLCDLLRPDWGVMTAIGPVHLEAFDSVEAIAREKAELLHALPAEGLAVVSADDPWSPMMIEHIPCRVVRVSLLDSLADYYGVWAAKENRLLRVHERATGEAFVYPMPLPGQYIAENAIRAIAVGREAGRTPAQIANALSQFEPLPMRWNHVEIGDRLFINDAYNANPVSMRAAMEAFNDTALAGDRWVVLAGMFELGAAEQAEHFALGEWVRTHMDARLIAIGSLGAHIAQGALTAGMNPAQVWHCQGPGEAAQILYDHAAPADGILLKASRGERLERVLKEYESRIHPI